MKKTLYIFSTFFLILSLFSCTTPPERIPTSEEFEETIEPEYTDESPFDFVVTSLEGRLYKVYPEEGFLVPACADPLCKHKDGSCPLTKMSAHEYKNGLLYYTRYNADYRCVYKICTYDLFTGEYKVLYEIDKNNNMLHFYVTDRYLYFNVLSGWQGGSATSNLCLMRYDLETGEAKVLADKLPDYTQILCEKDGRLYWYNSTGFFSTDFDYENRKDDERGYHYGYVTGEYAVEINKTGEIIGESGKKFPEKEVIRVDLKTGEKSIFIESTGTSPMLYNGKVIYTRPEGTVYLGEAYDSYTGKGIKIYDKYGSKLYIRNIDGSDDRILCDIGGNNCALGSSGAAGDYFGKGDYIIYKVSYYEPVKGKPEYIQEGDDRLLVINIVTGDYKILSAE